MKQWALVRTANLSLRRAEQRYSLDLQTLVKRAADEYLRALREATSLDLTRKDADEDSWLVAAFTWVLTKIAHLVRVFIGDAFDRMSNKVVTVTLADTGLKPAIMAAREKNIELISKLLRVQDIAMREVLDEGLASGWTHKKIAEELQARSRISQRHAKLIARDQTLKLNAAVTKIRQTNLGITHYKWITSQDERVRPTHEALNGRVFSWNEATPIGYHPGEDYQCRCIAQPVMPD